MPSVIETSLQAFTAVLNNTREFISEIGKGTKATKDAQSIDDKIEQIQKVLPNQQELNIEVQEAFVQQHSVISELVDSINTLQEKVSHEGGAAPGASEKITADINGLKDKILALEKGQEHLIRSAQDAFDKQNVKSAELGEKLESLESINKESLAQIQQTLDKTKTDLLNQVRTAESSADDVKAKIGFVQILAIAGLALGVISILIMLIIHH